MHSPAPWRWDENRGFAGDLVCDPYLKDADGNDIFRLEDGYIKSQDLDLIAAAPDLLIQCKNALSYMEVYNAMTPTIGQYELNIANSLRSVIAKAEKSQNVPPKARTE